MRHTSYSLLKTFIAPLAYYSLEHPRHCRRRGIASFLDQSALFWKSFFAVKIQDSGGHFTDCSQRVNGRAMQGKMVCPVISTWVKEPHQLTGRPIDRPEITPLVSVARLAGVSEILSFCGATVLDTDDMIHFAVKEGIGDVNQAILAKILGARTDQSPQGFADIPIHDCRSLRAR